MFVDYQIEKYLGLDKKSNTFQYQILIIDSDFSESVIVSIGGGRSDPVTTSHRPDSAAVAAVAAAVIEIYSVRQLNVAFNLYLLCRKTDEKFPGYYGILKQLADFNQWIKNFDFYENQIKQYHYRYNKQKVFW